MKAAASLPAKVPIFRIVSLRISGKGASLRDRTVKYLKDGNRAKSPGLSAAPSRHPARVANAQPPQGLVDMGAKAALSESP
jgi:hypothetical protein